MKRMRLGGDGEEKAISDGKCSACKTGKKNIAIYGVQRVYVRE